VALRGAFFTFLAPNRYVREILKVGSNLVSPLGVDESFDQLEQGNSSGPRRIQPWK